MTLHPQAVAALRLWAEAPRHRTLDRAGIAAARWDALAQAAREPREEVGRVEDVDANGVRCRFYSPADRGTVTGGLGCILYVHGGGFVFGELDTHDAQARRICNRADLAVVSVDFRRPPEDLFPAAPADAATALGWLRENATALGVDSSRLVAMGDSAGGNLALVTALHNAGAFAAMVLVYPFVDPTCSRPSYDRASSGLDRADAEWYWRQYVDDPALLADPDVAPIESPRLGSLPRTLVQVAEHDTLYDEDLELVRRMEQDGVAVTCTTYPGMVHGFWRHPLLFDASAEALDEIAAFVRTV